MIVVVDSVHFEMELVSEKFEGFDDVLVARSEPLGFFAAYLGEVGEGFAVCGDGVLEGAHSASHAWSRVA